MTHSTLGVAVTTHGQPTHLAACLRSICAQTRQPDVVVVSQDGQDPQTDAIVLEAAKCLSIRHLRNVPPLGERRNRRRALSETRADFIAILDGDDEWEPLFLELTAAALAAHPECGFCSADHWLIGSDGHLLETETDLCSARFGRDAMGTGLYTDVLFRHLDATSFSLNSTLFRRDALASVGFVPGGDAGTAPDYAIFLNLGARGVSAWYLRERLGRYRVHEQQTTNDRVYMASSAISVLEQVKADYQLNRQERALLARKLRFHGLELAIAYAHRRERRAALTALQRLKKGHGLRGIASRRLVVLGGLVVGAEPLLHAARRKLSGLRHPRQTVAQWQQRRAATPG